MATKLEQNRVYARNLGWKPSDFGAPVNDFTSGLLDAIVHHQERLGLVADGIAGPKTFVALLTEKRDALAATYPSALADKAAWLETGGQVALLTLKIAFAFNGGIIDLPPQSSPARKHSQQFIDSIIRTPIGINWTWEEPYDADEKGHGTFEWCTAACGYGWRRANLKLSIAKARFASNYRMDRYAQYRQSDEHTVDIKPSQGPYRKYARFDERSTPDDVKKFDPRAGDIALVGPVNSAYGKHTVMVDWVDYERGVIHTVEGNGNGMGPDGIYRQGVVRAQRFIGLTAGMKPTVYHLRRLIRVAPSDLI